MMKTYGQTLSSQRRSVIITKLLCYLFLLIMALICIIPFYLMLVNATRTNTQIDYGVSLMPGTATIENFKTLFFGRLDPQTGLRGGGLNILRGFSTPSSSPAAPRSWRDISRP